MNSKRSCTKVINITRRIGERKQLTDKGKQNFNKGVSVVQEGVNDGLNGLKTKAEPAGE